MPDHLFEKLLRLLERMALYYNKNRPVQNFEVGDLVMISSKNLDVEHFGVIAGGTRKFAPL